MRYIYQGHTKDGNGKIVTKMTVAVYEAGAIGITAANIYVASSGGTAVSSVTSNSTDGSFEFYVDDADYARTQKFGIRLSKTNFRQQDYDNLIIYPMPRQGFVSFSDGDTTPSVKGYENFKTANTSAKTITDFDDGYDGQVCHIVIGDNLTTIDFSGTNLKGNDGVDWKPTTNDKMIAIYDGTSWYCAVEKLASASHTFKSYSLGTRSAGTGDFYVGGFYIAAAGDVNLNQGSLTHSLGTANISYAAHVFVVLKEAGTTDGSDLTLTVTGTSITDEGVRTGSDSEVLVSDLTAATANKYYETTKKWIGQVVLTMASSGGTTYATDFNTGFAKYEDFGNKDFTLTDFEAVGLCKGSDSGFNIILFHHHSTGWTYSAAAFVAGGTQLLNMNTIHDTEVDINSGEDFAFKRTGLSTAVVGSGLEGLIIKVVVGAANAVQDSNFHTGVILQS